MVRVLMNIGTWVQHGKADRDFIVKDEIGRSFRFGEVCVEITVVILTVFIHFIRIIGGHFIQILLMDVPKKGSFGLCDRFQLDHVSSSKVNRI